MLRTVVTILFVMLVGVIVAVLYEFVDEEVKDDIRDL